MPQLTPRNRIESRLAASQIADKPSSFRVRTYPSENQQATSFEERPESWLWLNSARHRQQVSGKPHRSEAALPASSAQANLIVNGSYEDPSLNYGSWGVYSAIYGWTTLSGAGIGVQNHAVGTPYDGNNLVELDSHNNSSMYQNVTTVAGSQHTLSFAFSPRPGVPSTSNGIEAWWNGVLLTIPFLTGSGGSATSWSIVSLNVLGTGTDVLKFAAVTTSESLGGYLDDVRLTAVPDGGATLALLALATAGLAAFRRRIA